MKLFSVFSVFVMLGVAAIVLAESPSTVQSDSGPTAATKGFVRYEVHRDDNDRMMLDRVTGQTWELRTVLSAPTSADPAPIVVWFPIPKADAKLSQSILQSRISQLKHFTDSEFESAKTHIAELEKELGTDHPSVAAHKEELKVFSEAKGLGHEKQLLDLYRN